MGRRGRAPPDPVTSRAGLPVFLDNFLFPGQKRRRFRDIKVKSGMKCAVEKSKIYGGGQPH
jgi:hypothetical protein